MITTPDLPARRGTTSWVGALIAVVYLGWAGGTALLAPYGWWANHVFGQPLWSETDPGFWYLAGSHETFGREVTFPGHPGVPLRILLHGLQRGNHFIAASSSGPVDYTAFTARSLGRVFGLAKIAMSLLHLASFWLLFRFCKQLSCSDRAATMATLAYATCWPVVYYIARISVEPLVVICFLGAFVSSWKCRELMERREVGRAAVLAVLAALATVSGLFTKLHFHFALPLWVLPSLVGGRRQGARPACALRTRAVVGGVYLLAVTTLAAAYTTQTDVQSFERLWSVTTAAPDDGVTIASSSSGTVVARASELVLRVGGAWLRGLIEKILSGSLGSGLLLEYEWASLLLAAIGLVDFLVRNRGQRGRLLWASLYTLLPMPIIVYRYWLHPSGFHFHYFFLPMVVSAVLVGYLLDRALLLLPAVSPRREFATVVTLVSLLHFPAMWAAVDSKWADIRAYDEDWRPIVQALKQVGTAERVGVVSHGVPMDYYFFVNQGMYVWMTTWRVPLAIAIRDSLHFATAAGRDRAAVAEELRGAGVEMVVDYRRPGGARAPVPLNEWQALQDP